MKVLIVDDDIKIIAIVKAYLEKNEFEVITADDGVSGLAKALSEQPDIILLDVMMPGMDGFEVCRNIRHISQVPIIMLTASDGEMERLKGFDLGVDDYVLKPFSPREVVARVEAVLRRTANGSGIPTTAITSTKANINTNILKIGNLVLNMDNHEVLIDDAPITLTPTEFDILALFMSHPGRAFSRNAILAAVQDITFDGYDRSIDSHIKNLRKKLNADAKAPYNIKTVYGVGYKMIGE